MELELDDATLQPIVERAVGRRVTLGEWRAVPFSYQVTNPLSAGIWRISGTARDATDIVDWSVILKVALSDYDVLLKRFPADLRPELEHAYLWDREVLAFESGIFDRLPTGLKAPRLFLADRRADSCWLWLEDLGDGGGQWDIARYALAARHLGRFNGAFPAGSFEAPWLTRDWIGTWILRGFGSRGGVVVENDRHLADRERVVQRLNARPHALGHLDAFRKNLFDRIGPSGDRETAVIDWSYLGYGPVGAEVGHLVVGSVAFADYGQDIRALAEACLPAYIEGLRDGGWRGSEADVREGYALSAARWVSMLGWLTAVLDPVRQQQLETWQRQPLAESIAQAGDRTAYLLDLINGAMT